MNYRLWEPMAAIGCDAQKTDLNCSRDALPQGLPGSSTPALVHGDVIVRNFRAESRSLRRLGPPLLCRFA